MNLQEANSGGSGNEESPLWLRHGPKALFGEVPSVTAPRIMNFYKLNYIAL